MYEIVNISGYKFVDLPDPHAVRERLLAAAQAQQLKGTVLLASEGVNLFLAGTELAIDVFLAVLRQQAGLHDFEVKRSGSATQPFRKLLVKVKREIIRMNHPTIRPQARRAPAVDARTVRRWLAQGHDDQGRPVVALDTRNAFEVDHGSFIGAIDWRLGKFSDFPAALEAHKAELEGKAVVSFCTGGIRCEKAALYMQEAGLENVWQLEGGILKYFEETDGAHYRGSCFVFDQRESLDASLVPARDEAAVALDQSR